MHTEEQVVVGAGRRRRKHSDEFKAEAARACEVPGVSMAAVALSRGVNANLLRRWVLQRRAAGDAPVAVVASTPAFIPVALPARPPTPTADIRIEIKRGATSVNVVWPAAAAEGCTAWLRELLR